MELKQVKSIKKILEEKKAENVIIYCVDEPNGLFDYSICATALNSRHLNSLAEELIKKVKESDLPIHHSEGKQNTGWVIVDLYDVVINIFTEDERKRIDYDTLISRNATEVKIRRTSSSKKTIE